jgi:hypothetical protein
LDLSVLKSPLPATVCAVAGHRVVPDDVARLGPGQWWDNGPYELSVSASSLPLEVGLNDISVLLGRLSDAQLVLDAKVLMTVEPLDHPGEPQTFPAMHDNATNKLYYAANVVFPTPGQWKLTVRIDGPEGSVSTTHEAQVAEKSVWRLPYLLIGLPLIIVALFLVLWRGFKKAIKDDLPGGVG